jgi:glycosyltransferase involved in cell wall biosynthesis
MTSFAVVWHAPFLSGGGYCTEAISYAQALSRSDTVQFVAVHHGDGFNENFVRTMSASTRELLTKLMRIRAESDRVRIDVCHSEPGAWSAPEPLFDSFSPCPSGGKLTVARTMFETDRLPTGWLPRLLKFDQVWVPTQFSFDVFAAAGVPATKLRVVAEGVDTDFFSRSRVTSQRQRTDARFTFCSVGKFEPRKNLGGLVRAFLAAFDASDSSARLVILTSRYHSSADFRRELASQIPNIDFARVELLTDVAEDEMPSFYAKCDAFATATHGEGFGRPIVEAMSMGLAIVAPFWSGPTAFLASDFAVLVPVTELEPVGEGAFADHLWARIDEDRLRDALVQLARDPQETAQMGQRARLYAVTKLCLKCIATQVEDALAALVEAEGERLKTEL